MMQERRGGSFRMMFPVKFMWPNAPRNLVLGGYGRPHAVPQFAYHRRKWWDQLKRQLTKSKPEQ